MSAGFSPQGRRTTILEDPVKGTLKGWACALSLATLSCSGAAPAPTNGNIIPSPGEIVAAGWPLPVGEVQGYNLYVSDTSGKGFKKANDAPITGKDFTVKGLIAHRTYYFVLTSLTNDNPPKESKPSQEWPMVSHLAPGAY